MAKANAGAADKKQLDDAGADLAGTGRVQDQIDMNDPYLSGQQAVAIALAPAAPEKEPTE